MSRQDKATTERNARVLRDLVKQPDNKSCADCRKNDARWASWNLCSGIHRSMGTHISKVKSIDLDIWQPEQMEAIQKWGNKRANLYWERHLKAGHVPPDHKIESFIRSKYESRRWAMDGPPPADPATLESGGQSVAPPVNNATRPTPTSSAPAPAPAPGASRTHPLLSRTHAPKPSAPAAAAAPVVDLFGSDDMGPPPATTTAPPAPARSPQPPTAASAPAPTAGAAPPGPTGSNLFDLDFKAPTSPSARPQTGKADIMSLFSTPTSPAANAAPPAQNSFFNDNNQFGSWSGGITSSAPPQPQSTHATQTQLPQTGGWGGMQMDQGGWGAPVQAQPQHNQSSGWGAPVQTQAQSQQQQNQSSGWGGMTGDPWASSNGASNGGGFAAPLPAKKDDKDPFANLWS